MINSQGIKSTEQSTSLYIIQGYGNKWLNFTHSKKDHFGEGAGIDVRDLDIDYLINGDIYSMKTLESCTSGYVKLGCKEESILALKYLK